MALIVLNFVCLHYERLVITLILTTSVVITNWKIQQPDALTECLFFHGVIKALSIRIAIPKSKILDFIAQ